MKHPINKFVVSLAAKKVGGSIAKLARKMGLSQPSIHEWASGKYPLPMNRCIELEKITNGEVMCEEMRPDVDWGYLRGTKRRRAKKLAEQATKAEVAASQASEPSGTDE
ncbi:MAG: helix-turn-helix domain-containing protein [Aeromonas sp.]